MKMKRKKFLIFGDQNNTKYSDKMPALNGSSASQECTSSIRGVVFSMEAYIRA